MMTSTSHRKVQTPELVTGQRVGSTLQYNHIGVKRIDNFLNDLASEIQMREPMGRRMRTGSKTPL